MEQEKLIKRIDQTAKEKNYSGVISFSQKNNETISMAYGFKDKANKLPNNTDTHFGIASGTKLFTAIAIGKLIEQGKLTFETKVGDIFDSELSFIDSNAMILHLLTHTSGVFDYNDDELSEEENRLHISIPWYELETPSDYWPFFVNRKMKYKAGERVSYSDGGFVLLAIIIEKLTGQKYRDYIEETVLKPAGMTNTGFYAFNELPGNTALGYKIVDNAFIRMIN